MLNTMSVDRFAIYFWYLFLASTAIAILMSVRYLEIENENHGEYYALMLLSVAGMMCMAAGVDIVLIFIGLELMAISTYVLVGFLRRDRRSNEAALKYLLLGAFSSGIFAYGLSLLYGLTGSTNLAVIQGELARHIYCQRPLQARRHRRPADHHHRPALQNRRHPLSPVGARRLRRRAHQHHRIHVGRRKSRRMGHAAPHSARRTRAHAPHLGSRAGLRLHRHHDRRQLRRADPDQHQAPARLFLHRARRLHAARPDRRHRHASPAPTASKAS